MYLLLLIPALVIVYFILIWWFQKFFEVKDSPVYKWHHIWIILLLYICVIIWVKYIPDAWIANRVQHAIGGWFLMIILTYFSLISSKVNISRFQFIFLWFFIATTFGVFNELAESFLQNEYWFQFSRYINDTWFDLWANTIGAIIWVMIFTFLIWKKN